MVLAVEKISCSYFKALEFAPHKITVNCFSGGCINTEMRAYRIIIFGRELLTFREIDLDAAQVVSERMKLPMDVLLKGVSSTKMY